MALDCSPSLSARPVFFCTYCSKLSWCSPVNCFPYIGKLIPILKNVVANHNSQYPIQWWKGYFLSLVLYKQMCTYMSTIQHFWKSGKAAGYVKLTPRAFQMAIYNTEPSPNLQQKTNIVLWNFVLFVIRSFDNNDPLSWEIMYSVVSKHYVDVVTDQLTQGLILIMWQLLSMQ